MALSILRDKSYEHTDYHLHYYSINVNGKDLRSSTLFIKDSGKLVTQRLVYSRIALHHHIPA